MKALAVAASAHAAPFPSVFAATGTDPARASANGTGAPAWSVGFDGVSEDLPRQRIEVEGEIPRSCFGSLFRNGPALYERAGERYQHWFDPDGMIQAFRFDERGVSHEGRFVRTRKFQQEQAAGRFLYNGAGSVFENAQAARNNESTNVANINVQPLNGELLALWEAGMPYALDPETLATRGPRSWSEELAGVPFSAHPKFDENGDLWNIGSVPWLHSPKLVLYHVGANGKLRTAKMHGLDFGGYIHDFVLTPEYLVVLNSSAIFGSGHSFVDQMHWQPQQASQLLVFQRSDLSLRAKVEVPASFVFHFGNGWQDRDGLHFTACQYEDSKIVTDSMRRFAQQQAGVAHAAPTLVRYDLERNLQRVEITNLDADMEFPSFDPRRPFTPQTLLGASGEATSESALANAVSTIDPLTGDRQSFDYGDGVIVQEPLFIAGPDGGYAMHGFLDYEQGVSGVAILRAANLAEGPIAKATMERVLPLGFHGCFVSA